MTLATHGGGRCCRDEGGETAAMRALFEDVDLRGRVLTLGAPRTCRDTARSIGMHGADCVLSVKENCPGSFAKLAAIDWDGDGVRRHADKPGKGHGRIETRRVAARDLLPDTLAPFPEARQAFRVVRERIDARTGAASTETAYGVTSVAERAGPERLLAWNRGHWQVENGNHFHAVLARCDSPPWARTRPGSAPATPRQPRHAQQHRARRGLPQRLPLPARGEPPLRHAPRRRVRRHPLARLSPAAPPNRKRPARLPAPPPTAPERAGGETRQSRRVPRRPPRRRPARPGQNGTPSAPPDRQRTITPDV